MEKKIKKEKWEEVFDKLLYKTANNINEGGLVADIGTEPYKRGTADIKSFISQLRQDQKEEIKTKLNITLTDPDNYLRGNLEDLIKEL